MNEFDVGDIVIVTCYGPQGSVFTSLDVIAGDDPGRGSVLISGLYAYDVDRIDLFLVGRVIPLRPENVAKYPLEAGQSWMLLRPRLPPP